MDHFPRTSDILAGKNPSFFTPVSHSREEIVELAQKMMAGGASNNPEFVSSSPVPTMPDLEGLSSEEAYQKLIAYNTELEAHFSSLTLPQKSFALSTALAYDLKEFWETLKADNRKSEFAKSAQLDNTFAWVFDHFSIEFQIFFLKLVVAIFRLPLKIEELRQTSQDQIEILKGYIFNP
jgi:hypothetical protein